MRRADIAVAAAGAGIRSRPAGGNDVGRMARPRRGAGRSRDRVVRQFFQETISRRLRRLFEVGDAGIPRAWGGGLRRRRRRSRLGGLILGFALVLASVLILLLRIRAGAQD